MSLQIAAARVARHVIVAFPIVMGTSEKRGSAAFLQRRQAQRLRKTALTSLARQFERQFSSD